MTFKEWITLKNIFYFTDDAKESKIKFDILSKRVELLEKKLNKDHLKIKKTKRVKKS